jgi:hypothetical protein
MEAAAQAVVGFAVAGDCQLAVGLELVRVPCADERCAQRGDRPGDVEVGLAVVALFGGQAVRADPDDEALPTDLEHSGHDLVDA